MKPDDVPPRVGLGVLKRALAAFLLVTFFSAAAVASAALLQVDDVINVVEREGRAPIELPEIDRADAGSAQTLMILGSDERFNDKRDGAGKPRSDTIILVRLDPDNQAISIMSLPRDLKVTIPGNSVPTKINAAYEQGGARLTLRTVKSVLSTDDQPFKINHLVSIGFEAFQRAINYVGCVYYDVDQRYFNDNSQGQNYAAIDIKPGYQRICGQDALDYVRHRHNDNDLVRAARQQDFLRQSKNQRGVQELKDPRQIKTLAKVFSRYFDSDAGLRRKQELFGLAKLAIYASNKPVREIPFEIDGDEGNGAYLIAREKTIRKTVGRFMAGGAVAGRSTERSTAGDRSRSRARRKAKRAKPFSLEAIPGLTSGRREGEEQALLAGDEVDFPVYFPSLRKEGARMEGGLSSEPTTRTYSIRDEVGRRHAAYRMSYRIDEAGYGEFYGVQGTTWRDPPILDDPDEVRTIRGRKLALYYDGRRIRMVAWKTSRGVYWVSNTLVRKLSNKQMLGIGASLDRLG